MALQSWPATPDPWLDEWVIWRFKGSKPADRPAGVPNPVPAYASEYLSWATWQRKGKPNPRPDIAKNIPSWAHPILKQLNQEVPIALPDKPEGWVLAWAISRFRNEPKPTAVPDDFSTRYPYVWSFLRWVGWRRKGGQLPRPKDVPASIPPWAWDHLKQVNIAVPLVPPPPPPPPPPDWENSWKLPFPIMFTTWGWLTDGDFRNVEVIAQRMKNAEVKTVALQIGQFSPDVPDRLRAFGFKIALWGIPGSGDAQALADTRADGYIPQIEGPSQYVGARNNLDNGVGEGLSLSTVTTLAGLESYITLPDGSVSTEEVEELKRLGLTHAIVECYKQDGNGTTHFPISKMMWSATRRGIPYANPIIGLYWDVPVDVYQPDLAGFGKQVGAYTAETMRPIDWAAFKAL